MPDKEDLERRSGAPVERKAPEDTGNARPAQAPGVPTETVGPTKPERTPGERREG